MYCYKPRLLSVNHVPSVQKADGFRLQSQTIRLLFVIFYPTKQIIGQQNYRKTDNDCFLLFGPPEFTIRDYSIILHPTLFNVCNRCIDVKYSVAFSLSVDTSVTVYTGGCRVAMR